MPRVDLNVPFHDKDQAKALGARWDQVKKTWYVPSDEDAMKFARWHPVIKQWHNVVDAKGRLTQKGRRLKEKQLH